MRRDTRERACLILALVLVAASVCYWSAFAINSYATFHTYWDVGNSAYDMYYHIHYPSLVHGLQYLSFSNHLAPDQLLVLPLFYLYQSPLTLLLLQAAVLSLTGLLIFFMARDLLKGSAMALLLCLAWLINPGMHGMLVFDYHAEFLFVPLMLLTFYFFMRGRRTPFLVSALLLLGSAETSTFLAAALGIGLLSYELLYDRKTAAKVRRQRVRYACCLLLLTALSMGAYAAAGALLSNAYAHGLYPGLPQSLQVVNFNSQQITRALSSFGGAYMGSEPLSGNYKLYGLAVVILGFGLGALFVPEIMIILILPWLAEGFLIGNGTFFLVWYQYFSYALGGIVIAVFLGMKAAADGTQRFRSELKEFGGTGLQYKALLALPLLLFLLSPVFILSVNLNSPVQNFLFETGPAQTLQIRQLYSVMALIPQNASVLAPAFAASHLSQRREAATILPLDKMWFTPQYVLLDFNDNISANAFSFNQSAIANAVVTGGGYYLYARNGTAELYRRADNYP